MTWSRLVRRVAVLAALATAYVVAGKLGLRLAFVNPSATAVWAPTGLALASLLMFGWEVWPAIFAGAFVVNITTAGTLFTSLGIATGNTLEALAGAYLVNRWANGRRAFERPGDVLRFTLLAAVLSTMVSASLGMLTLAAAGSLGEGQATSVWLTWWLGDAGGDLVVAPALLLWAAHPRIHWPRGRWLELTLLLSGLVLTGQIVFDGLMPAGRMGYPLEFLLVPFLLWAGFRFGPREGATATLLLAAIAITGTIRGLGPFSVGARNESLLLLDAFLGVASVKTLIVAAVVAQRRRSEEQLRQLSISDPLTGLGNYRQLITSLEAELRRFQRAERPFAVVLLDLDGLKRVNDRHGHLVGSRALCRVAEALARSCRAVDTAARFGGDEFALVLPETDEAEAQQVVKRVTERLAADAEKPKITVSHGVALCPRDGSIVDTLLAAADRALYGMKGKAR